MSRLTKIGLVFAGVLILSGCAIFCRQVLTGTTTMPIEVIGPVGTTETVEVFLPPQAASADGLWLVAYNLNYEAKAALSVNEGAWKPLTHETVILPTYEQMTWGMKGPSATLRMTVPYPVGTFHPGKNTITFRFDDVTNRLTAGYRILNINVSDRGTNLLRSDYFAFDDPLRWKPPVEGADVVSKGSNIWFHAQLRDQVAPQGTNHTIFAHCTDCHHPRGIDLAYFNYSPRSIIERAKFHKLSQKDAELVASYILSLRSEYEYAPKARPWNPPYQPGPGLDSQPVSAWAAGAGLEWVTYNELDMLTNLVRVDRTNDLKQTLNARETPISMQLPDWGHWLPKFWPGDSWPDIFPSNRFMSIVGEIRADLATKPTPLDAAIAFKKWETTWDGVVVPLNKPGGADVTPLYTAEYTAMMRWKEVQTWAIMFDFKLEGYGREVMKADNPRSWFHGTTFRQAPHMIGGTKFEAFHTTSMQWYAVQIVLNDGNRWNPALVPVDWGYQFSLTRSAGNNPVDVPFYSMMIWNMIKGGEVCENAYGVTEKGGWSPWRQDVYWLAPSEMNKQFSKVPLETRQMAAMALLPFWEDKTRQFTMEQYQTAGLLKNDSFKNIFLYTYTNLQTKLFLTNEVVQYLKTFGDSIPASGTRGVPVGEMPPE